MLPPDLRRLLRAFNPPRFWFALGVVLALISALLGLLLTLSAFLYMAAGMTMLGVVLRSLAPLRTLARYAERLATHSATFRALANLRLWFFRAVAPLAPGKLGFNRSGDLLSRMTSDIDALDGVFLRLIVPVGVALLMVVALYTVSLDVLPHFTLLAACWISLLALVMRHTLHAGSIAQRRAGDELSVLRTHVVDGIDGLSELMANEAGHVQQARIAESTRHMVIEQLRANQAALRTTFLNGVMMGGTTLALLTAALLLPLNQPWQILLLLALLMAMNEALGAALPGLMQRGRMNSAAARLLALTDQTPNVAEPVAPLPLPETLSITFDEVVLTYGRPTPALDHLSFSMAAGERLVLTGPSGAGKSSLLGLLLGFYQPEGGRLLIGGIDSTAISADALRARIGYLSQRTQLISGTVRANLLLATPGASEDELWAALSAAEISDVVRALPEGLDTWVGEAGILLSGGQARRLAIAQLLLRKADLWLLDEPTEGLDSETATAILTRLGELAGARSVLLITHQTELVKAFGPARSLFLHNGKLADTESKLLH